jgi:hypothetical protein
MSPQINKVRLSEASSDKAWRTVQMNTDNSFIRVYLRPSADFIKFDKSNRQLFEKNEYFHDSLQDNQSLLGHLALKPP